MLRAPRENDGYSRCVLHIYHKCDARNGRFPGRSFHDPAFAEGARAVMREFAPQLLGLDAAGVDALNRRMDIDAAAYSGLMLSTPEALRQHTVDSIIG